MRHGPRPLLSGTVVAPTTALKREPPPPEWTHVRASVAVATLAVVVFNVYQLCGGPGLYSATLAGTMLHSLDAAVPWLFVLIGYLLFAPIVRWFLLGVPDAPAPGRALLTRRALQLLPAYYLAVTVVWFSRQPSLPGDWKDLLEHLTFTQVFDGQRIFYTDGPAWAISVVAIYGLLMSLVVLTLGRFRTRLESRTARLAALSAVVAMLAVLSLGWKAYALGIAHRPVNGTFPTWFGPAANLDTFAAGMVVALSAVAFSDTRLLGHRQIRALRAAAATAILLAVAGRSAGGWGTAYFGFAAAVGFACLLAADVLPRRDSTRRWASGPVGHSVASASFLGWLGTVSYGIYLWHEPVMLAMSGHLGVRPQADAFGTDVTVVLIASVLVGWASYRIIELPVAELPNRWAAQR